MQPVVIKIVLEVHDRQRRQTNENIDRQASYTAYNATALTQTVQTFRKRRASLSATAGLSCMYKAWWITSSKALEKSIAHKLVVLPSLVARSTSLRTEKITWLSFSFVSLIFLVASFIYAYAAVENATDVNSAKNTGPENLLRLWEGPNSDWSQDNQVNENNKRKNTRRRSSCVELDWSRRQNVGPLLQCFTAHSRACVRCGVNSVSTSNCGNKVYVLSNDQKGPVALTVSFNGLILDTQCPFWTLSVQNKPVKRNSEPR